MHFRATSALDTPTLPLQPPPPPQRPFPHTHTHTHTHTQHCRADKLTSPVARTDKARAGLLTPQHTGALHVCTHTCTPPAAGPRTRHTSCRHQATPLPLHTRVSASDGGRQWKAAHTAVAKRRTKRGMHACLLPGPGRCWHLVTVGGPHGWWCWWWVRARAAISSSGALSRAASARGDRCVCLHCCTRCTSRRVPYTCAAANDEGMHP
jgi:hypothetical protein